MRDSGAAPIRRVLSQILSNVALHAWAPYRPRSSPANWSDPDGGEKSLAEKRPAASCGAMALARTAQTVKPPSMADDRHLPGDDTAHEFPVLDADIRKPTHQMPQGPDVSRHDHRSSLSDSNPISTPSWRTRLSPPLLQPMQECRAEQQRRRAIHPQ